MGEVEAIRTRQPEVVEGEPGPVGVEAHGDVELIGGARGELREDLEVEVAVHLQGHEGEAQGEQAEGAEARAQEGPPLPTHEPGQRQDGRRHLHEGGGGQAHAVGALAASAEPGEAQQDRQEHQHVHLPQAGRVQEGAEGGEEQGQQPGGGAEPATQEQAAGEEGHPAHAEDDVVPGAHGEQGCPGQQEQGRGRVEEGVDVPRAGALGEGTGGEGASVVGIGAL